MMKMTPQSACKYEQIIDAAVAEFQENGFAAASMDRISASAAVSKRTVYKYFDSKEKLFQSIILRLSDRLERGVEIKYSNDRPVREQLAALGHAEGCLLRTPEVIAMARLVISEVIRSPELAGETQDKLDLKAAFEDMFRDAVADGQLTAEDPRIAAEEFVGLIKARAFWPVIFGAPMLDQATMDQVIGNSVEIIMRRYGTE